MRLMVQQLIQFFVHTSLVIWNGNCGYICIWEKGEKLQIDRKLFSHSHNFHVLLYLQDFFLAKIFCSNNLFLRIHISTGNTHAYCIFKTWVSNRFSFLISPIHNFYNPFTSTLRLRKSVFLSKLSCCFLWSWNKWA
jgi:hypothetical protein